MPPSINVPHAPEIVWFTPSSNFQTNPVEQLTAIGDPRFTEAVDCAYYGFRVKDRSTAVLIMGWKSIEAHHTFMENECYPELVLSFMDSFMGQGNFLQVLLAPGASQYPIPSYQSDSSSSSPPSSPLQPPCSCSSCRYNEFQPTFPEPLSSMSEFRLSLEAPFVQFLYLTARSSKRDTPDLSLNPTGTRELRKLVRRLDEGMKTVESCLSSCWAPGITLGKENTIVGIIGWESFEHCKRETRSGGRLGTILANIEQIALVEWTYGNITRLL